MPASSKDQPLRTAIADLGWRAEVQLAASQVADTVGAVAAAERHRRIASDYSARAFEVSRWLATQPEPQP